MNQTRQDFLARWTTTALGLAAAASVAGVVLRGDAGALLDTSALVLLCTLPTVRVVALAVRWRRSGDTRFAGAAAGLLAVMAAGVVLVVVSR